MNEYLAIDSGGHLYANSLCALKSVWLDASLKSQDGAQLNTSARVTCKSAIMIIGYCTI